MKYTIVNRRSAHDLAERVTAMLSEGWQLTGGVSVATDISRDFMFAQALVKENSFPSQSTGPK